MKTLNSKIKILAILTVCMVVSFNAAAQDTIRFTWKANAYEEKSFQIAATHGEMFVVSWDDSTDSTYTGAGNNNVILHHTYSTVGTYAVTIVAVTPDCSFTDLNCSFCQLSNLDVSKSTALTYLNCHENQLSSLNLSNNAALTELYCGKNPLNNLNVSNNTALTVLVCWDTPISRLDVKNNTALVELSCYFNQLSSLDVSNNTALMELYCSNNKISNLILSNNTKLTRFICENNQINRLDVTNCTDLVYFNCSKNSLTNLDVSNNTELQDLYCDQNQLVRLNVSNNVKLARLDCYNNHLPLSDLYIASKVVNGQGELGSHRLQQQKVNIGEILFSEQSVFDSIYTDYVVIKDCFVASQSDYTVANGTIIFHTMGNYSVTMSNTAIVTSFWWDPVYVIVDINVNNVGIVETHCNASLQIYPNPTTNQLRITNYELRENDVIEIYDVLGRKAPLIFPANTTPNPSKGGEYSTSAQFPSFGGEGVVIDVSHLSNGIYFLKTDNKVVKFIKQ